MVMSCHQNARQNYNLMIANKVFENIAKFEIFRTDSEKSKLHAPVLWIVHKQN
jgi:hypothetical protein